MKTISGRQILKDAVSWVGVGGNYYITALEREPLVDVCEVIGKSPNSIYYRKSKKVWAIRIKRNSTKKKIRELLADPYIEN